MPIFLSGQEYRDEAHLEAAFSPAMKATGITVRPVEPDKGELKPSDNIDHNMVVTPPDMLRNQQMDAIELGPDLGGIEVGYKQPLESPTEPAGAFNSQEATKLPDDEKNLSAAFLERLTGTSTPKPVLDILKRFVGEKISSVKNALSLPGDVWTGKIDATSDQAISRALDLASIAVGGPAPLASKLADGTLGSFAGVRSKGIRNKLSELGHAQILEANAVHPDEIFNKTGFFRGVDGRWRYEIDDSKAKFFPQNIDKGKGLAAFLSDVYSHKELFQAYPDLKYIRVKFDSDLAGAAYQGGLNPTITLGKKVMSDGRVAANDKGILAHEIQHAIQEQEGFAKGGMAGKAGVNYNLKLVRDMVPYVNRGNQLLTKQRYISPLTDSEKAELEHIRKLTEKFKEYADAGDKKAFDLYQELAGEVEARNVDTRVEMTPEHRRRVHPDWTSDTPRSKQLITNEPTVTNPYLK